MLKLEILKSLLKKIVNDIDAGNTEFDEKDCDEVISTINKLIVPEAKYSKYQSAKYLGVSIATFDNWVRDKKIPKGRREQGFKEIFWLKKDLDNVKNKMNRN